MNSAKFALLEDSSLGQGSFDPAVAVVTVQERNSLYKSRKSKRSCGFLVVVFDVLFSGSFVVFELLSSNYLGFVVSVWF